MMLCAPAGPCGHVGGHVGASMTRRISSPLPVGPKRVTSFARVVAHPRRRPCDHYRHRADRSTRPCRARDRPPGRGGSDPGVESRCVPRVGARARRHDVGILADSEAEGAHGEHQKVPMCRREVGGGGRSRTADGDFADLCLTTWLRRPGAGIPYDRRQTTEHQARVLCPC